MIKLTFLLPIVLMGNIAYGADAYFVRFAAAGPGTNQFGVAWVDDVIFFNSGSTSATIKFLGVSNATAPVDGPPLVLQPGQMISLRASSVDQQWRPSPPPPMWILHLDVPADVIAESRDEYYTDIFSGPQPTSIPRGKVSMPIFRETVPSNVSQTHLGTDLSGPDSRANVGIYNAGAVTATARIQLRRACDGAIVDSREISVPPNSVIQTTGMKVNGAAMSCPNETTLPWQRYAVVTVDQPSFSFVSNLNDNLQSAPGELGIVPIVGLAVSKNERF